MAMIVNPKIGSITYDKADLCGIQQILSEMRSEAQKRGQHQEAANYKEIAGYLHLELIDSK